MTDSEKIEKLTETLKLFADQYNWQNDNTWHPIRVDVEARFPDTIAADVLSEVQQ